MAALAPDAAVAKAATFDHAIVSFVDHTGYPFSVAGAFELPGLAVISSSNTPGTMITALGLWPFSNNANFNALARSTKRPPQRCRWSWTTH